MSEPAKPVPTPYSVGHTRQSVMHPSLTPFFETAIHVRDAANRGNCFAIVNLGGDGATDMTKDAVEATAGFLVRASNSHAALVAACQAAVENGFHADECDFFVHEELSECDCYLRDCRAALALMEPSR